MTGRLSFVSRARRLSHYVVRIRSSVLSLRVRVNVMAGALRAVYLKHGTCALYPEDIDGRQCDAVTQLCHMTWYERFDRYTGSKVYSPANVTTVPTGGDYPDKRATGDWFISLQDAGVARRTDFTIQIDEAPPERRSEEADCDRFGRYDCSNDLWKVPPDLGAFSAAAPATARSAAPAAAWALAGVLAFVVRGRPPGRRR